MSTRKTNVRKTILVVDDERSARELLKHILEQASPDYVVLTRNDSLSALKALYTTPCDLVVLDVNLPDQDGVETATLIRKNPKTAKVPIVMVTAQGDKGTVLRALKAGANDYVVKPFSVETLVEKLERYLWGETQPPATQNGPGEA